MGTDIFLTFQAKKGSKRLTKLALAKVLPVDIANNISSYLHKSEWVHIPRLPFPDGRRYELWRCITCVRCDWIKCRHITKCRDLPQGFDIDDPNCDYEFKNYIESRESCTYVGINALDPETNSGFWSHHVEEARQISSSIEIWRKYLKDNPQYTDIRVIMYFQS